MATRWDLQVDPGRSEWKTTDGDFKTKVSYLHHGILQGCPRGIGQEEVVAFHLILPSLNDGTMTLSTKTASLHFDAQFLDS